jgi:hypothetical protein
LKYFTGIGLLVIWACGSTPETAPLAGPPAFFHWKTTLSLTAPEQSLLNSAATRCLYVKFADLGVNPQNGDIEPYSLLRVTDTMGLTGRSVVPCVFLTNEVFQQHESDELDTLALRVVEALNSVAEQFPEPQRAFTAVLLDCDWTASTRERYFAWLRVLQRLLPSGTDLCVTLRLHQYRYPEQTGLPPADRVMLMLYNTGDVEQLRTGNSIFDPTDALAYVQGAKKYPIPMDLALPVFQWALIYRDATLWKIWPDPPTDVLNDTLRFSKTGTNLFTVKRTTFQGGLLLGAGDQVKLEAVDSLLLRQIKQIARQLPLAPDATVAYYHLEPSLITRLGAQTSAAHFRW